MLDSDWPTRSRAARAVSWVQPVVETNASRALGEATGWILEPRRQVEHSRRPPRREPEKKVESQAS